MARAFHFILRDGRVAASSGMRSVSDPHGEERVFARLRTMLRIALENHEPLEQWR